MFFFRSDVIIWKVRHFKKHEVWNKPGTPACKGNKNNTCSLGKVGVDLYIFLLESVENCMFDNFVNNCTAIIAGPFLPPLFCRGPSHPLPSHPCQTTGHQPFRSGHYFCRSKIEVLRFCSDPNASSPMQCCPLEGWSASQLLAGWQTVLDNNG